MNFFSILRNQGASAVNALGNVGNAVSDAFGKATGLGGDMNIDIGGAFDGLEPEKMPTFVEAEKVALPILAENSKPDADVPALSEREIIVHPPLKNEENEILNDSIENDDDEEPVFEDASSDFEKFIEESKNEVADDEALVFHDVSSNLEDFVEETKNEKAEDVIDNVVNDDYSLDDFYSIKGLLGFGAQSLVAAVKDTVVGTANVLYNAPSNAVDLTKAAYNGTKSVLTGQSANNEDEDFVDNEPDYPTVDHLYENIVSDVIQEKVEDVGNYVSEVRANIEETVGNKMTDIKTNIENTFGIDEPEYMMMREVKDSIVAAVAGTCEAIVSAPMNLLENGPKNILEVVQSVYDTVVGEKAIEDKNEQIDTNPDDKTLACNDLFVEYVENTTVMEEVKEFALAGVFGGADLIDKLKVSEDIQYVGEAVLNLIEAPVKQLVGEKAGDKVNHYLGKAVNVLSTVPYCVERVAEVLASNEKGAAALELFHDFQDNVDNLPSGIAALLKKGEGVLFEKGAKILLSQNAPEALMAQNKADLKELTGDDRTHDFLMKAMPLFGLEIRRTLIPLILKKGAGKEVLINDKARFEMLLNTAVPRVVANLGKKAQEASKDPTAPVSLFDIGLFLKASLSAHFELLEAKIAKLDPNLTPSAREVQMRELIAPIVEDLLKMAFPNGKDDLPVNYIKIPVWDGIVDLVTENVQKYYTESKNAPKTEAAVQGNPELEMALLEGRKVLCTFADYMSVHGDEINERFKKVRQDGKSPEDDPQLQKLFSGLSKAVINHFITDEEGKIAIPSLLRPFANDLVDSGLLVKPLIGIYQDVLAPSSKEEYLKRLQDATGAEVSIQIENWSKIIGGKISDKIVEKFVQPHFAELSDEEKRLQHVWKNYLNDIVQTIVIKGFVGNAEQCEGNLKLLPAEMANKVQAKAHERFADDRIARKVNDALKIADPVQRTKALRKAFRPLAKELFGTVVKGDPLNILPVPGFAKEFVLDMIVKEILPDLLAEKYVEMTKIMREDGLAKEKLQDVFKSGRPSEACRVMAAFVRHMIPAQLVVSDENLAKAIHNAARAQLGDDATEQEVNNYMLEHGDEIKALVAANLRALGDPNNGAMNLTWEVAQPAIEAIMRKGLATISSRVEGIADPKVMVNMVGEIAWAAGHDHMGGLNQLKRDLGVKAFSKLPIEEQFRHFKNLHESVPNDEEALAAYKKMADSEKTRRTLVRKLDKAKTNLAKATSAKKIDSYQTEIKSCRENLKAVKEVIAENKAIIDKKRKDAYYGAYGKDMLKLAGFSKPSDLPVIPELQDILMPLVEDFAGDAVMMVVDKLMSPAILDSFALKALDILNATDKELAAEMNAEKIDIPVDLHQRNLDRAFGVLIMEMVQMAPLSGKVLPIDGLKHLLGEKLSENQAAAIGHSVRELLIKHDVSFKMLIEQGITEGLPAITQGKWEKDDAGNDVFVPYRWLLNEKGEKVLDDNGNPIEVKAGKFSFDIAKTKEESEAGEIQEERNRIANEECLREKIVETVRTQLHGIVSAQAKSMWDGVKGMFEKLIVKCFGEERGAKLHGFLMKICEFAFFKVLGSVLMTLYKPVDMAIWWIAGFYIRHKASTVIEAMHSGIHANLAGHISDIVRKGLMNNIKPEELEKNFLEEMAARKVEEERLAAEEAVREEEALTAKEEQKAKLEGYKQQVLQTKEQGVQIIKQGAEAIKSKASNIKAKANIVFQSPFKSRKPEEKDDFSSDSVEELDAFNEILEMKVIDDSNFQIEIEDVDSSMDDLGENIIFKKD